MEVHGMHHETQFCQSVPPGHLDLYDPSAVQSKLLPSRRMDSETSGGTAEIIRFPKEILDFSWKEAISTPEES